MSTGARFWCPSALLGTGWADDVAIDCDADGAIVQVAAGTAPADRERLAGTVLPGIPNVHSHAHQRAMAGLAEHAGGGDSFWTWREAMYRCLEHIGPDELYAVARQLYAEMLVQGYTAVAEFQYLHHDVDGRRYADRAEMTLACLRAARDTGIGFTALPVLYRYAGFGGAPAEDTQKRFVNDADGFLEIHRRVADAVAGDPGAAVGIAPHSLRAVTGELLQRVCDSIPAPYPIHVHVAEQVREVEQCLAHHGQRPVEFLLNSCPVDESWCLVHATHMNGAEHRRLAQTGAVAGLCPTTEANLGDGFFDMPSWRRHSGRWAVGSDSHISISPVEELRWLEYGQRLMLRSRNVIADASRPHTGEALLEAALAGGAAACGRPIGRLAAGSRADFLVLDHDHPRLLGRRCAALVDSWIFSGNDNPVREVFVGGRRVVADGVHLDAAAISNGFESAMRRLL